VNRWIAVLSVTGLFVIGILIGALGTHLYYAHAMLAPAGAPGRALQGSFAERLDRRLGLSTEQREEVDRILHESHVGREQLRGRVEPLVREHLERTHHRIAEVLTPEQRDEFAGMIERHRRPAAEWLLRPPGRRPGRRGPPPPR
jgi:hypothetical protein